MSDLSLWRTRDHFPEIDDVVGFASWYDVVNNGAGSRTRRHRTPPPDEPFIGRVTSARGDWGHQLGIVARHVADNVVVIHGGGVTYWSNVGVRVIATQTDVERSGAGIDIGALVTRVHDVGPAVAVPCLCQDDPEPRKKDREWDGGALAACDRCRCHWHRVFPSGRFLGPVGPWDVGVQCVHQRRASGYGCSYDDYVASVESLDTEIGRVHEDMFGGFQTEPFMYGVRAYCRVHNAVRDYSWLEAEVETQWPGCRDEYRVAWTTVMRDLASHFERDIKLYQERSGDGPVAGALGLDF